MPTASSSSHHASHADSSPPLISDDDAAPGKHKRRPIERGSKHRKRRRRAGSVDEDDHDLDGFIAHSDSDDDLVEDDARDDGDADAGPQASTSSRRSVFPSLTNLILLHGPTGSGKTSSVHAAAAELGWSVFEVWPGIGKRAAKDVERYVGDVSKNHMVRSNGEAKHDIMSMFKKIKDATADSPRSDPGVAEGSSTGAGGMQSLILFDEVDVLYKDERDFWTGLMALAADSQRPIVLTCTGERAPSPH